MSARAGSGGGARGVEALVLAALVFGGALAIYAFFGGEQRPLDRSALGHRGLVYWLQDDGQDVRYAGFQQLTFGDPTLRILPIVDTDLDSEFQRPTDDTAFLMTGDERDIPRFVVEAKLRSLKTLIIAPKWTRAMRYSGYAHDSLLLPRQAASAAFQTLKLTDTPLERLSSGLVTFAAALPSGQSRQISLYSPQVFAEPLAAGCVSHIAAPRGHLLIACARGGDAPPTWALSDPDLLNNHGLSLAENAPLAAELVRQLADGAPVLIDTTTFPFTFPEAPTREQRSWAELARFFAYPFAIAWGGLALLTGLLFWRAWVRLGPPRQIFDDDLSAARSVSIAAKARILRLAGNDRRLFATHVANRLRRIERGLFGQVIPGDPQNRIVAFLTRRDPALAAGFAAAATAVTTAPPGTSNADLAAALEEFELQAGRVLHES